MTGLATQGSQAVVRPRTFLNLVLDESSSMDKVLAETISAVNEFLQSQRRARIDELFVSLTTFSDAGRVKTHYRNRKIEEVPDLTKQTYRPSGCTALYDGIHAGMRGAEEGTGPGDRILMVILTDGENNASREITHVDQLRQMVHERIARGNWSFVFLGANINAQATGQRMGFDTGNVDDYVTAPGGVKSAIAKVDTGVKSYRTADDLKTSDFYHQPKKWTRPQWSKGSGVVLTDTE